MPVSRATIELVFQDETGSTGALTVHIPVSSTYAAASSASDALGAVVASLTGCVLVRSRIKYRIEALPTTAAVDGSSVKRRGVFIFQTDPSLPFALIEVPGILDSVLVTTGVNAGIAIDTTLTDVDAFITGIEGGLPTNPFGDDITELMTAYRQSRV